MMTPPMRGTVRTSPRDAAIDLVLVSHPLTRAGVVTHVVRSLGPQRSVRSQDSDSQATFVGRSSFR